jgi:hypothetical protein
MKRNIKNKQRNKGIRKNLHLAVKYVQEECDKIYGGSTQTQTNRFEEIE